MASRRRFNKLEVRACMTDSVMLARHIVHGALIFGIAVFLIITLASKWSKYGRVSNLDLAEKLICVNSVGFLILVCLAFLVPSMMLRSSYKKADSAQVFVGGVFAASLTRTLLLAFAALLGCVALLLTPNNFLREDPTYWAHLVSVGFYFLMQLFFFPTRERVINISQRKKYRSSSSA